ncbi:MAG TPA: amino acid ABC transporter permease [Burkholderiaceae bacterium]|nr:amino acid ABC transporter permease [Burkholderiaceae bacterium]
MNVVTEPVAARPAPERRGGALSWMRAHLFGSIGNAVATIALAAVAVAVLPPAVDWAVVHAVVRPDSDACQAARGTGACWGGVVEKFRLIVFGRYPYAEQGRPVVATLLVVALLVASCTRRLWSRWLVALWIAVLAASFVLMRGGFFGLAVVATDLWGGLPLTLLLSTLSLAAAFPLSVLIALGRRSHLPLIRALCTVYVELVRGVPLISVLFMASFMFPLLLPAGVTIDVLLRVLAGITLFAAAYGAEVVRGGLQAIGRGQHEAAAALGLSTWQAQRKVVLPQALAIVVPGLMNNFISTFKDTSLVTIVSLYELTGSLGLAFNSDGQWRPFRIEAYLFIAAIYWIFCFSMSRYSRWIERRLDRGTGKAVA